MPIYRYRCQCGAEEESLLPMADRDNPQPCKCGLMMERVMALVSVVVPVGHKDKVLNTLNRQKGGYKLPAKGQDRTRVESALAKGLNQSEPVVGRGFG